MSGPATLKSDRRPKRDVEGRYAPISAIAGSALSTESRSVKQGPESPDTQRGRRVRLDRFPARREWVAAYRTDTINRIHKSVLELLPGGAKRFLSAFQARTCSTPSACGTSSDE